MTKNEKLKMSGTVYANVIRDGKLIQTQKITNLITSAGKAEMAGLLINSGSPTAFTHIAIGTGATAAVIGNTTLETESMRVAGTPSLTTTTVTNDTAVLLGEFNITSTLAITESGILNAATNGTLLNRAVFSAINVISGDTLNITWEIQFS